MELVCHYLVQKIVSKCEVQKLKQKIFYLIFLFVAEQKSDGEKLQKLVYIFIILVVIIGCVASAALAISVSKNDSSDQPEEPRKEGGCSSRPCRNQATCLNTADLEDGYVCICPYLYYGSRCENGKHITNDISKPWINFVDIINVN